MSLRILQVSHAWKEGGSGLYASALCDALSALGHQVERFGPPASRAGRGFVASFRAPEVEAAFARASSGADVVHVHHLAGLSLSLPRIAREAGAIVAMTLHDHHLACARGQLVNQDGARCDGPALDRCARCLAPHLYAPAPPALAARLPLRRGPVAKRVEDVADLIRAVHWFTAPSRVPGKRLGIDPEILPLPLLRRIRPAPAPGPGPVRFLFLGSLIPTKGPHLAVEAFASLPSGAATLRLVGPSPAWAGRRDYAEALVRRVAEIPGASHRGAVDPGEVEAELHAADVLLFPSTWEENAPLVLGEAAAAGLRILASDLGGVAECCPVARLVEPDSVPAWRHALADEVRRGRVRSSPLLRESMEEHSATIARRYADLIRTRRGR